MIAEGAYTLRTLISVTCAFLLMRAYGRSKARPLLWSGLCFVGLALNNVLLILDKVIFPDIDFAPWRTVTAVLSLAVLAFGLIWEAD